ncbi:MFS transporter [SAR92 clade bacterium H231]|nr:MFS transporter [SAR92 clade bacterium H231]
MSLGQLERPLVFAVIPLVVESDSTMLNNQSKTQLTNGTLIVYGGLALPLAIAELPIILYLPAFYAKEVGLSIGMVGLVFLLARLWDGISDPIIGTLSDRTASRFGRRKPWIAAGTPIFMAAAWCLCNPPAKVELSYLFLWAILFYTAQTIIKIPYWSWGAELSANYEERSKVTGFRESGGMIGNLIVAAAPLLLLPSDAPVRDVLLLISILLVVLIPITAVPLTIVIKDHSPIARSRLNVIKVFKDLWQNGPMKRFLMAVGCLYISLGVINSIAIFLIDIGFGLPGAFFSLFFTQYVIAILVAPLLVRLASRVGKHVVLAGAIALLILASLAAFLFPMGNYLLISAFMCVLGVVFSCLLILPASILADIVDYDTARSGEERTGIYMAALNLVFKLGLALGVGVAYGFLDIIGFDAAAATHTAYDVLVIRITFSGINSVLLIPAILILWKFPITKKVQQELRQKIRINAKNSKRDPKSNFTQLSTKPMATPLLPDNG